MSPSSLLQRVAGRAGGNGQGRDQRPEHDSAAEKPLPLEDKSVPQEQPPPKSKAEPGVERAKQALEMKDRFQKLVAAVRAGEAGLTFQVRDDGSLEGLVMLIELSGTDLRMTAAARMFCGTPISVHFPQ